MIDLDPLPITGPGTTPGQSPGDSAAFASALDDATTAADAQVADDTGAEATEDAEVETSAGSSLELAFTAALAPTVAAESTQQPVLDDDTVPSAEPTDLDVDLAVGAEGATDVAPDMAVETLVPDPSVEELDAPGDPAASIGDVAMAAPVAAPAGGSESAELPLSSSELPLASSEPTTDAEPGASAEVDAISAPVADSPIGSTAPADAGIDDPNPAAVPVATPAAAGDVPVEQAESTPAAVPTVASSDGPVVAESAAVDATAPVPTPAGRTDATAAVVNPVAMTEPSPATAPDATAPAEMPAAPPATADLDAPPPAQQLAEALRDVRRMSDGSHRLSLQLHPEELGAVQLEVAVRDGQLHLRAVAETDSTRRLLAASIPELREQLTDAGVSAGSLEVGAESAADHQRADAGDDSPTRGDQPSEGRADGPTDHPTSPIRLDAGQLDVQL